MSPTEYQKQCRRTANLSLPVEKRVLNFSFGFAGEVGELVDLRKKELFHCKEVPRSRYEDEIGDAAWYLANLATEFGYIFSYKKRYYGNADSLFRGLYKIASAFEFLVVDDAADCLFSLSEELGCKPFDQILDGNIEKLMDRYPHGWPYSGDTQIAPGGER